MPALAGEPFRGLAKIRMVEDVGGGARSYTASITDVVPNTATGHQADYQGRPGAAVTIRFEWDAALPSATFLPADTGILRTYLPGGAQIGADVTLAPAGASGSQTFTLRFDDNPLDAAAGSARWGALELFIQVQRAAAGAWGPVDSRGNGTPQAATTMTWARGMLQAPVRATSQSISNVALGGSAPSLWGFPDPVYSRIVLEAQAYESFSMTRQILRPDATVEREETINASGATRDASWTGTTGTNRRIGDGMFYGSESKHFRIILAAAAFGDTNKFVFDTTGHDAAFTRDSELQMTMLNRLTVDPRITIFRHHFQLHSDVFALAAHQPDKSMLSTDSSFLWTIYDNARGEGLDGLSVTQVLAPVLSGVTLTEAGTTATQGGRAGVVGPLRWVSSKPGGTWNKTSTITAPADADDPAMIVGSTTDVYVMKAQDPAISLRGYLNKRSDPRDHFSAGDVMVANLTVLDHFNNVRVDPARITDVSCTITRFRASDDRAEYLELDGVTWTIWEATAAAPFLPMTPSPADPRIYVREFTLTGSWTRDIAICDFFCRVDGTPYIGTSAREEVGRNNLHSGHSLDAVGLALSGKLGLK